MDAQFRTPGSPAGRVVWSLAVTLLTVACQDQSLPPPIVESVEPRVFSSRNATVVVISGRQFYASVQRDLGTGQVEVLEAFSAIATAAQSAEVTALLGVERVDAEALTATVRPDIPAGTYSLRVEGPAGQSNILLPAFVVCPDEDGDGKCSASAGCVTNCDSCTDHDGDGWGLPGTDQAGCPGVGSDCDDADATLNPGASEVWYDGVDQNCDGQNDYDRDGDAFVDPAHAVQVGGSAPSSGDCNDEEASVNPGAAEIAANGRDDDCDGIELCFVDSDNDGFRPDHTSTIADNGDLLCTELGEAEASAPVGDCNDTDPTVHPDALETVGNQVDENCDGQILCYLDTDADGHGSNVGATIVDDDDLFCLAADNESLNSDDCDDGEAQTHPGGSEQAGNAMDEDCSGSVDCYKDADNDGIGSNSISPDAYGAVDGRATAGCGDNGGDGVDDTNTDCNDSASTCADAATDCVDDDGDGTDNCLDRCEDVDGDDHGATRVLAACVTGSGPCDLSGDAACLDTDCNDSASTCADAATDCVDDDGDGTDNCLDRCEDVDGDDHGATRTLAACITGSGPCDLSGDAACLDTDCNDSASTCANAATDCVDDDGDGTDNCLDRCEDVDGDDHGATRTLAACVTGSGPCDLSGDAACLDTDCNDSASTCANAATDCVDDDDDGTDNCLDRCEDVDGDDHGATRVLAACVTGSGSCDLSGDDTCLDADCDDSSATASDTFPGAAPNDGAGCMKDVDGDDYGDADPPAGVAAGNDCDDDDVLVYPGTLCDDGNACTGPDKCGAGICMGEPVFVCEAGMAVWRSDGTAAPVANVWDGSTWNGAEKTIVLGEWRIIAGAAAPDRLEKIVLGVDSDEQISGEIWDGSDWKEFEDNTLAKIDLSYYWAFDVAYEQVSGDAVVVWKNNTTGSTPISYRVWNGTAWLGTGVQTITTPASGRADQMFLAANPNSDELVLAVNTGGTDYALVWDGDNWVDSVTMATGSDTDICVAYEQQSGHALVAYGVSGNPVGQYQIWNGSGWTTGAIPPSSGQTRSPRWMRLASDPGSDSLVLGVETWSGGGSSHIWLNVWDGNAWAATGTEATAAQTSSLVYPAVAVAFEGSTGEALATYAETASSSLVHYRTWNGAWSGQLMGPSTGTGNANSMVLAANPRSNVIMLAVQNSISELHYVRWDGGAWGSSALMASDTGEDKNQPFVFLWSRH